MPCAPTGEYRQGMTGWALRPFQAWQSLNSVAGACSSPYRVVGAAFSLQAKNPTWTYDNHYAPRRDSRPLQWQNKQSPRHPLPMGLGFSNPIRHAARRGGMGCTHLLNEVRAWPTKINEHATSDTVCHVIQGRRWEKGGPKSFEGPSIPLVFSSFSRL